MQSFLRAVAGVLVAGLMLVPVHAQELTGRAADAVNQLNEQIDALNEAEKWNEAYEVQLKVIQIFVKELGPQSKATAAEMEYAADQLFDMERYREAKPLYEQVLKVYGKAYGQESEEYVIVQMGLGQVLRFLSENDRSRSVLEKALPNAKRLFGTKSLEVAQVFEELGMTEFNADNMEKARDHLLSAVKTYRQLEDLEGGEEIFALTRLGAVENVLGNDRQAEQYLNQAHKVAVDVYGSDSLDAADVLLELGSLAEMKGDLPTARRHYERVLAIAQLQQMPESETARFAMSYLANVFTSLGDYVSAEQLLQKLYRIEVDLFGKENQNSLYTLMDLAYLDDEQDKHREAREKYGEALELSRRLFGETHTTTLDLEHSVAGVDHLLGKYDEARERYDRILAMFREKNGSDSIECGYVNWSRGWLEHDAGQYETARKLYDQALEAHVRILGPEHPETLNLKMMRAYLSASEKQWDEAFDRFDAYARDTRVFNSRILASLSPTEQILYLKMDEEKSVAMALALANSEDPAAVEKSAGWLLNYKGVSQESLAARETLTRDLTDAQSREIAQQLLQVRQELASLALAKPEEGEADARTAKIAALSKQEETLGRQLAERVGKPVVQDHWVELDAVRGVMTDDQLMVNIIQVRPIDLFAVSAGRDRFRDARYIAYIIPPKGKGEVQLIDLGESAAIDRSITEIRSWISDNQLRDSFLSQTTGEAESTAWQTVLAPVKEKLWDPIAKRIPAETKQLLLSPDGALWLMPWNSVPTAEDRFLIEDYSIRYLTSGRELVLPKDKAVIGPPLLFADPSFDLTPDSVRNAVQSIFRSIDVQKLPVGAISRTAIPQVSSLPSTRLEAMAIAPSVTQICGKEPIQYLGKFALETVAKQVKSPKILVLSTHGFFLPEQDRPAGQSVATRSANPSHAKNGKPENPLLRCGLLLAGCNNPTARGDDGILTGMEILSLDLRGTELVVLSACETGVGKVNSGEGVAGLRQAFQLAGAKTIVSTLWQVPDRDSALLMRDFFQNVADGNSHSEALRQAQIQRIEARRSRYGAAHPFYWAAWTLTGV
ncbi:CHAT domain protein [Bremerella volcania]|uniref:CHAT domain protein n=1 Tax=Bremerella volcania TaxID=2527984 RepID=A0A518CC36_9BACT|nr:CHAT domain-containing protein [Bremerella volcania]QDU76779.1 CHAT domain protein [Bremerella volcania]